MIKLSAAYLAGVFTVLLAVLSAGGHAALISFAGGIVLTLAVVLLWSSSRPPERAIKRTKRKEGRNGVVTDTSPPPHPLESDLCSALVNFQVPRRAAAAAAAAAIRQAPEADFGELFRIALRARKAAA